MHGLLEEIRIGISYIPWAFVFPLRRGGTCPVRTWNCSFCATSAPLVDPVFPVASRFGTETPALPRYAPRSVTIFANSV